VEKVLPSGTTVYAYDAFGQVAAEYTTAPVKVLCTTCYLSYDYLGSVRMVTDSNANVVARHDFAPFGQEIPLGVGIPTASPWSVSDNVGPKFTGQMRDTETGEDFFHARYLSSGLGRFMSVDPYNAGADITNPQSWNGYAYVGGQPLVYSDPTGEDFGEFLNWVGGLFGFGSGSQASGPTFYVTGYCYGCVAGGQRQRRLPRQSVPYGLWLSARFGGVRLGGGPVFRSNQCSYFANGGRLYGKLLRLPAFVSIRARTASGTPPSAPKSANPTRKRSLCSKDAKPQRACDIEVALG
jgi:RHS repeat-associated protein